MASVRELKADVIVSPDNTDNVGGGLETRDCSNPGCFYSATCLTYSDCHVCTKVSAGKNGVRGYCI